MGYQPPSEALFCLLAMRSFDFSCPPRRPGVSTSLFLRLILILILMFFSCLSTNIATLPYIFRVISQLSSCKSRPRGRLAYDWGKKVSPQTQVSYLARVVLIFGKGCQDGSVKPPFSAAIFVRQKMTKCSNQECEKIICPKNTPVHKLSL